MKSIYYPLVIVPLIFFFQVFEKTFEDTPNRISNAKIYVEQTPLEESISRGEIVYKDYCNRCHRPKGKGMGKSYPPLAGSDYLVNNRMESIRGVKFGQEGEIVVNGKTYNKIMEPMGLTDNQIADVMNYVMNTWGNTQDKIVTPQEVAAIKK